MRTTLVDDVDGARFRIDYLPLYSYAACLAALHPVSAVAVEEPGSTGVSTDALLVRLPEIEYERSLPVAGAGAGAPGVEAGPVESDTAGRLAGVSRRVPSHVVFSRRDREIARLPVTLLPVTEWSHRPESRLLIAAHVVPGDEAVARAVVDAAASLPSRRGGDTLLGVAREAGEAAAHTVSRALYDHLATNGGIAYGEPRAEHDSWSGASYQTIRAPHRVLGATAAEGGPGNCLDLSLLLAGCLESLGLHPLIVFPGTLDESPRHALVGCWRAGGRRFRPLLTDAGRLREKIDGEDLLVLEATGVCTGERRLSFPEARRVARERLAQEADLHAVDVSAARPPQGRVRPLDLVNAPVVQRALLLSEELRGELGAEARETLHVLYGLCAGEGEVTARMLEACGGNARRVCRIIRANLPREGHEGPGVETKSFRICRETARLNARTRGSFVVEEIDLLWAVLDSPSRNVRKALESSGCDFSVLLARMSRRFRRPRQVTVSRAFDSPADSGD
jgi:hypothetical protein